MQCAHFDAAKRPSELTQAFAKDMAGVHVKHKFQKSARNVADRIPRIQRMALESYMSTDVATSGDSDGQKRLGVRMIGNGDGSDVTRQGAFPEMHDSHREDEAPDVKLLRENVEYSWGRYCVVVNSRQLKNGQGLALVDTGSIPNLVSIKSLSGLEGIQESVS